jgi:guanylate kinase
MTEEQFKEYIAAGHFLEYALVHGNYYGTLTSTIREALNAGKHVLLDIDVQGAEQIREGLLVLPDDDPIKQGFLDVFIAPPSLTELRGRLEGRAEDTAEVIEQRMANAEQEMSCADEYEYYIINDDIDTAVARLRDIIEKESEVDE